MLSWVTQGLWSLGWYLCLKVSALFILLILVRVTVPRLRIESLSRLGWVSGLSIFSYVIAAYGVMWFLL